jgi:hypothetical protein
MRRSHLLYGGLFLLLTSCQLLQPPRWLEPGKDGEVLVRKIPEMTVVESEVTGRIFPEWRAGLRTNSLYLAEAGQPLQAPILLVSPLWHDLMALEEGGVFYVQSALTAKENHALPRQQGLALQPQSAISVVGVSWVGPYNLENISRSLAKAQAYLKQHQLPASGPARVLFYSNPEITLDRWCVGEVQIPIAADPRSS